MAVGGCRSMSMMLQSNWAWSKIWGSRWNFADNMSRKGIMLVIRKWPIFVVFFPVFQLRPQFWPKNITSAQTFLYPEVQPSSLCRRLKTGWIYLKGPGKYRRSSQGAPRRPLLAVRVLNEKSITYRVGYVYLNALIEAILKTVEEIRIV